MKLTGRQKAFLAKFLELYRQAQKPLHYTDVAAAVGVAKITAYDMLRLLEKRGLVRSEYVLRGKGQGAGRSTVVCVPTDRAQALHLQQTGTSWDRNEWETFKERILDALEHGVDYQTLLEELLHQLSERSTPLVYTAKITTAIILNLLVVEQETITANPLERLQALGLPGEVGLNALSGLAVGLSIVDRNQQRISQELLAVNQAYQQSLVDLSNEGKRLLSSFVQDVMRAVAA